jgi:translation initiation factor IF-3
LGWRTGAFVVDGVLPRRGPEAHAANLAGPASGATDGAPPPGQRSLVRRVDVATALVGVAPLSEPVAEGPTTQKRGRCRIVTATAPEHRINDRIRAREVRLVDPDGQQLGIKPLPEALTIARGLDLDLVEVAPMANPPVCRIMDYGKFKFDEAQRAKESRRKTVHVGIKEMKYRPKIGPGDFDTKTRQVGRFLEEGHKVKVTIMFRGREVFHPELGKRILDRIAEKTDGIAKVESEARLDGRNMVMVLAPDKRAKQSAASKRDAEAASGTEAQGTADGTPEAG